MNILFINPKNPGKIAPLIAIFLIGTLLGAALITVLVGYRIDELNIKAQDLQKDLFSLKEENDNLYQLLEENKQLQKLKVEKIEPVVTFTKDTFNHYEEEALQLELQKKIKTLLKDLKGKEISTIDYYLIPQIINNRHVDVLGRTIKMQVNCTVIAPQLTVYVHVFPVKASNGNNT